MTMQYCGSDIKELLRQRADDLRAALEDRKSTEIILGLVETIHDLSSHIRNKPADAH